MRHRWTDTHRTYGSVRSTCLRCGIQRDARFDRNFHWLEWKRLEGEWFVQDKTPECQPVEALAAQRETKP